MSCSWGVHAHCHMCVCWQGLEPCIRAELWPFLLDVFTPESTCEQRQQQHLVMVEQYQTRLLQCQVRGHPWYWFCQ
jgi:hypothetical protein